MENLLPIIQGDGNSPSPFPWQIWYESIGGRTINIPSATEIAQRIYGDQYQRFEGTVADVQHTFPSEDAAAAHIKQRALELGADIVGIARVEPSDIYQGRTVTDALAVVVGQRMDYEAFVTVPSESAAIECMRIYETLGEVVIALANEIRALGWNATVEHPIGDSSVMHIPLALKAGFGELGRHGSIIHPTYGPLFRIGSVLTSMPISTDAPINVGIGDFCDKCQACRIFCPADAIPDERSANGRYMVDTGKCFPYFARRNYCSACLATCAYKHKQWAQMHDGSIGPFPDVPFGTIPPPTDPEYDGKHDYPMLRRGEQSPFHRTP